MHTRSSLPGQHVPGWAATRGHREGDSVLLAASDAGGSSFGLIMIVVLIAAMYFLLIRPQNKRRREAQQMQSAIGPGDEIVTIGGLYGTVTAIDDETLTLEIAPGVSVRYARGAVARVVTQKPTSDADATDSVDNSDAEKTIEQG